MTWAGVPRFTTLALIFGFICLYAPTLAVIVTSFNDSRLAGVWTGFSLRWYGELFADPQFLRATANSLIVAALSACLAVVLGTAAGMVLSRQGNFRGRLLFMGLLATPLMLPDVITGLSLLLVFVGAEQAIGWPTGRSLTTIIIAHTTLAMTYVAYVVQARLVGLPRDIEEAAADLGATPAVVFATITVPLLAPALGAGWLLAFVLSLDDLVVASFTSGPQSTTLPMAIFSAVRLGVSPKINALATLLVAFSACCLGLAAWLHVRRTGRLLPT
jgi:putrescine transport system permease protein